MIDAKGRVEWKETTRTRFVFVSQKTESKLVYCFISSILYRIHGQLALSFAISVLKSTWVGMCCVWLRVGLNSIVFICLVQQAVKQFVHMDNTMDFVTMQQTIELNSTRERIAHIIHNSFRSSEQHIFNRCLCVFEQCKYQIIINSMRNKSHFSTFTTCTNILWLVGSIVGFTIFRHSFFLPKFMFITLGSWLN